MKDTVFEVYEAGKITKNIKTMDSERDYVLIIQYTMIILRFWQVFSY